MKLTVEVMEMLRSRPAERVWLTLLGTARAPDFDAVARAAGLEPLGRAWVEIDADRAQRVLSSLHRDMAYGREVMPKHRAQWLARLFLGAFGRRARYATNTDGIPNETPFGWTPATGYTFDAVIGGSDSGAYWAADDD